MKKETFALIVLYLLCVSLSSPVYADSTLVQATSTSGAGSSITKAFGTNVTAGNVIVVCTSSDQSRNAVKVNDTRGDVFIQDTTVSQVNASIDQCWHVNSAVGGSTSVTASSSNATFIALSILEVSGLASGNPVDATGTATFTSGATVSATTTNSASQDAYYAIGYVGDWDTAATFTAGAGYTIRTTAVEFPLEDNNTHTGYNGNKINAKMSGGSGDHRNITVIGYKIAAAAPASSGPTPYTDVIADNW